MLSLVFTGCLDKYPDNAIPDKEAIQSVSDANQAVIGIYASYKSSALYSGYLTLLPDIQADLVYAVEGFSNTYGDIWRWDILATNREIEAVYSALYTTIGRCNYFFESIVDLENTLTDDEQLDKLQDLKGEAYCTCISLLGTHQMFLQSLRTRHRRKRIGRSADFKLLQPRTYDPFFTERLLCFRHFRFGKGTRPGDPR